MQKCRDTVVSDKEKYPTFARTIPSTAKVSTSVISLMQHFAWTSFTLIVGDSVNWRQAAVTLRTLATNNGINVNDEVSFNEPYVANSGEMPELLARTFEMTRGTGTTIGRDRPRGIRPKHNNTYCIYYGRPCKTATLNPTVTLKSNRRSKPDSKPCPNRNRTYNPEPNPKRNLTLILTLYVLNRPRPAAAVHPFESGDTLIYTGMFVPCWGHQL